MSEAPAPDLLVGDTERAAATAELRRHYEAGRLTLEEFETRLGRANGARTESDLRAALEQLPSGKLPTLSPRDRRWRSLALQYGAVNLIAVLVWLFTGAQGDFWPKWVLLATLIMFIRRLAGPRHPRQPPPLPPPPDQPRLP